MYKNIIKVILLNIIKSCEKYSVNFNELIKEINKDD